jgi:catechol 2,3-dioxygenase-like lactoylglutathione lyase family enzyme
MTAVTSIGFVTLETADLSRQSAYYTEVLGLAEIGRTADEAFFAARNDACSVILRRGEGARLATVTLRVPADADLAQVERELAAASLSPARAADAGPNMAERLGVVGPEGLAIDLVRETSAASAREAREGIRPLKLGHVAFTVKDPQKAVDFFVGVLGFRVSDWMGDFFAFLRCGPDHHTINFLRGEAMGMHHHAFEARNFEHIKDACDLLGRRRIPLLWGPGRHGVGHNIFTYHHNPDRQTVEVYTELDQMSDESRGYFDPRPWHEDNPQRPKVWTPGIEAANIWGLLNPAA